MRIELGILSLMQRLSLVVIALLAIPFPPTVSAQEKPSSLDHFEIGRHTFFDFGPPFDYYELLLVRSGPDGSALQRILVTPPGVACVNPATVETSVGSLRESPSELLGKTDPCSIPEKELRRELKRCKKCSVFSGANVSMRFPCDNKVRLIRSDILDKDMFLAAPNTPEHTSWTMQLLRRLDKALGPGLMDKPMFRAPEERITRPNLDSEVQLAVESGAYDSLFPQANPKVSDLYRLAQVPVPPPTIRLVSSTPFAPQDSGPPGYPPLARLTRTQGNVALVFLVDSEGHADAPAIETGHPLLVATAKDYVSRWRFAKEAAGQQIHANIEFALNCPRPDQAGANTVR